MTIYEAFLFSARLAAKNGSSAVACSLYELAITWRDDPLDDLKKQHGDKLIDITRLAIADGRKIKAIKEVREASELGLREAKELVEEVASRLGVSFT